MSRSMYCWRCEMVLPMLDETEWAQMEQVLMRSATAVQRYRAEHGVGIRDVDHATRGAPALALYEALTGFRETNPLALLHHRASLYGPPCGHCGRPLRTPQASLCAACGARRD